MKGAKRPDKVEEAYMKIGVLYEERVNRKTWREVE